MARGRGSSVLDVNAGYIHCINNQYKTSLRHKTNPRDSCKWSV